MKDLIPFFVADRPASLRILRGIPFTKYKGPIGIMAHANTSGTFQDLLRIFPCNPSHTISSCDKYCSILKNRVIKMCDSGVYTKNGCSMTYDDLFNKYTRMGVDYGIIIDRIRNKEDTIKSAKDAMTIYNSKKRKFKLVGVAQGRTVKEYLECYSNLKSLDYDFIAVGGLLKKRKHTSHYNYVRGNNVLFEVLEEIRKEYPQDWLFALGCYHPSRHLRFQKLNLFGSDYKGWIFNYTPKNDLTINRARISRFSQVRHFISNTIFESPLFLNGRIDKINDAKVAGKTLIIISCGAVKIWDQDKMAGPKKAKNVYVGSFFKNNKRYAEMFSDRWTIISAKYGLISPEFIINKNYNIKFNHRNQSVSTITLRAQIFQKGYHKYKQVIVLGGKEYGKAIEEAYAGLPIPIICPLRQYPSIGYMTQNVKNAISKRTPLI